MRVKLFLAETVEKIEILSTKHENNEDINKFLDIYNNAHIAIVANLT